MCVSTASRPGNERYMLRMVYIKSSMTLFTSSERCSLPCSSLTSSPALTALEFFNDVSDASRSFSCFFSSSVICGLDIKAMYRCTASANIKRPRPFASKTPSCINCWTLLVESPNTIASSFVETSVSFVTLSIKSSSFSSKIVTKCTEFDFTNYTFFGVASTRTGRWGLSQYLSGLGAKSRGIVNAVSTAARWR